MGVFLRSPGVVAGGGVSSTNVAILTKDPQAIRLWYNTTFPAFFMVSLQFIQKTLYIPDVRCYDFNR